MDQTIGLLGGGQLGRMLCEAANSLGVKIVVLDAPFSPAKQVHSCIPHIDGSFTDPEKIRELARRVDIITVESEHVNTHVLEEIAENGIQVIREDGSTTLKRVQVQPSWRTIRIIQDKYQQKQHLKAHGVQTIEARPIGSKIDELQTTSQIFGFPFMVKSRKDAYDGKGNFVVKKSDDFEEALEVLKGKDLYAEKWADFQMELAIMVVKFEECVTSDTSATVAYPVVETIHRDNICHLVYAPAREVSEAIRQKAAELARKAVGSLWGRGIFGVELFLLKDGGLVINEIAPRPHNSGHYTIEACPTMSQYKSQLLSVLGIYPSFSDSVISMVVPAAIMLNILGGISKTSHEVLAQKAREMIDAGLHMYGKDSRPGRKIGHVTVISNTMHQAETILLPLIQLANNIRVER
ncbi:phosphoribosylaminoimidazole carboxylase [Erysiphe necator]|nr:phosphoribosylaminoimidazole carboxylase [Erysiphe necator]